SFVPPPPDTSATTGSSTTSTSGSSSGGTSSSSGSGSSSSGSSSSGSSSSGSSTSSTTSSTTTEEPLPTSIGIRGTAQLLELHISRPRRDLDFTPGVDGTKLQSRSSDLMVVTYHLAVAGGSTNGMNGLIRAEGDRLAVLLVEQKGAAADTAAKQQ